MRPIVCLISVIALCWTSASVVGQTPEQEIAQLKAEVVKLNAENQALREELAKLKTPTASESHEDSPPEVRLFQPLPGNGLDADKIIFTWTAVGHTLAQRPISLYYAEKAAGPWLLIVDGLEADDHLAWRRPLDFPRQFFLGCRAREKNGNEVKADTKLPVYLKLNLDEMP